MISGRRKTLMNTRSFIKLFITLLVLVGAQIVSKTPEASQNVVPQIADGSECTPWTPTTCFPPAMQQELADGGTCIPWTPTTCFPPAGMHKLIADGSECIPWTPTTCFPPAMQQELADGGTCIPWTPTTCFPPDEWQYALHPKKNLYVADGGVCTPWTPTTCFPPGLVVTQNS